MFRFVLLVTLLMGVLSEEVNPTCCKEGELLEIKDILHGIQNALQNGEYCGTKTVTTPSGRDCYELQQKGVVTSGVYTVTPDGSDPFEVFCDMDTDGGGWTVFQRREDGSVDFYRDWADYANGFGSLDGEYWLGNDKLFHLTDQKTYTLRIDLGDFDDASRYAVYDSFTIADRSDRYRLNLGDYTGDAGDAMRVSENQQFSTRDRDSDTESWYSCALKYKGGWWYNKCHNANLNGQYLRGKHTSFADGVNWKQWRGHYYSLERTEMKIRPVLAA